MIKKKEKNNPQPEIREIEERIALLNILEDTEEERKRAEEEKNKTLAIINNLVDGLLVFDKENNLLLINPKAENFLKVKAEKIIGKSTTELIKIPTFKSLIELIGKKIKKVYREEVLPKENVVLEVTTIFLKKEKERMGAIVVLHDISREKLVEKMKTEFVSLSAHQLRTPLSAIKWTLRMILDGDVGKILPEQRNLLEKTYQSNEKMINLINDLLNVTRIEEGRYLYGITLANLEDIVQSVIESYKEEIKRRKIKFKFEKPERKLPDVWVDVEKIRLAIQNLLDNSIRYSLEGGKIIINLELKKGEIEFQISDTGIGIPKDQQKRVFSKFFRGANAIRAETEGTGLGLFITKNIIEAHGGKIWFKSKEGKGTTFYFTLPLRKTPIRL